MKIVKRPFNDIYQELELLNRFNKRSEKILIKEIKLEKRCIIACKVLWREISYLVSISPFYYDVVYLDQGLHNEPANLKTKLQEKITEMENNYSVILIGYGLCSNGIVGITSKKATLILMRGHDCITFFLGSKELYRSCFDELPGTYWYNTGWIDTSDIPNKEFYDKKFIEYKDRYDEDTAEYLLEMEKEWLSKYNNLAYINQGITDEAEYVKMSKEAARYLNWNYKELKGDLNLISDWIMGNWTSERFLVLEPNDVLTASFEEKTIIKIDPVIEPPLL